MMEGFFVKLAKNKEDDKVRELKAKDPLGAEFPANTDPPCPLCGGQTRLLATSGDWSTEHFECLDCLSVGQYEIVYRVIKKEMLPETYKLEKIWK